MKGGWYGPLVDLTDAGAHVGHHVQLVVLTLKCDPPLKVETKQGTQVVRSVLYVGDNTRVYFKVSLWKNHASQQLSAGDILFLQISEKAVELCQDGPATKEKLKLVLEWTISTQLALVSFLDQISGQNESLAIEGKRPKGNRNQRTMVVEVKKCSSLNQVRGITEPSLVEFSANIGDICLPLGSEFPGKPCHSLGWVFFSKCLYEHAGEELLKKLVCIGCKQCGCPLHYDHNRVYEKCSCLLEPSLFKTVEACSSMNKGNVGWMFRPFILHIWDESSQLEVNVKHSAAVKLFASITAERVAHSLQKQQRPMLDERSNLLRCNESLEMENNRGDLNYCSLLILLLRCMLRRGKNSPFSFKVLWEPENKELGLLNSCLTLVDFGLPPVAPSRATS